ncbi:Gfo/Idh/MocA family protein [Lacisediminihabitans sp.]|jgi:predicted dehydrogenase|uniref:Gfo/Idh/MocA family protein n=1 Tax=Lacisediminihabitans sp. TaxID=2787631 RepID=UPI002F9301DA
MADRTPIRTGIIGYGLSGRVFHSPFISTNPRFSLEVISTSHAGRQTVAKAQHPNAEIVGSPDELFERKLDLVVLASPAHVHLEQGLAAIASGAALVIDKPFAATTAEAETLIVAAEEAGVPLSVFQNRRWDGDFLTVRRLLAEGALGSVHRFESTFERWSPGLRDRWQDTTTSAQGAGITYDLGSHLIDQALQLFGPASVAHAELAVLRTGGVSDDEAFISLLHESGVRSHLTLSRFAAQNAPRFRVLGSASAYSVYGLDGQEPALGAGVLPTDDGFGVEPPEKWGQVGIAGSSDTPLVPVPTERGDYAAFYAGIAAAIREGEPVPVIPREALETLRIIERVHEFAGV